jgi:hypothetical protein
MRPNQHVTISVGSGVILGLLMRSWVSGVSCCIIGIFIDLDHYLDFWLNRGFTLSPKKFLDFCYHGTSKKFYDALHGYEYIPVLLWTSMLPGWRELGWGLTVGYCLHLVCDQCFNTHLNRWTYFLTYRFLIRFEASRIVLFNPFNDAHNH